MTRKLVGLLLVLVLSLNLLLAVPSSAESVTLRFIDVSPSPVRQEYYETTFAKFKEETGISVVYESVPWDDAANKLTVLGTSGQLPDVLTTWAGWLGQFTAAGWVHPLTDYIGDTTDQYADTVTKLVWKGEKELYGDTYTVPDGVMVKGVFVRKDWAADAGLNLDPAKGWTYSEYFDAVYKLTDPEKNHYGTSFRGARGAFDPLYVYLLSFSGGRAYADDGAAHRGDGDGRAAEAKQLFLHVFRNGRILDVLHVMAVNAESRQALLRMRGQNGGQIYRAGALGGVQTPDGLDRAAVEIHRFAAIAPAGRYTQGDVYALAAELVGAGGAFRHAANRRIGDDYLHRFAVGVAQVFFIELLGGERHAHRLIFQAFANLQRSPAAVDNRTNADDRILTDQSAFHKEQNPPFIARFPAPIIPAPPSKRKGNKETIQTPPAPR